jgi:DNA-binding transcriptional regulator PaaX
LKRKKQGTKLCLWPTEEGQKQFKRFYPEKDGIWKIVIFDIPEKHKYVRVVLRAKLKALQFKKWQNSIWVSPFELDKEIEQELQELSKKFFVRLIKTTDINNTSDLQKLFP